MAAHEHFFLRTFNATAPLLLWAIHFFGAYIFTAMSCATKLVHVVWSERPAIGWLLAAWTFLAMALVLWLLLRAVLDYKKSQSALMSGARFGCALLGAIGIAWTSIPLFILPVCTK
jgi:hypothetical protein